MSKIVSVDGHILDTDEEKEQRLQARKEFEARVEFALMLEAAGLLMEVAKVPANLTMAKPKKQYRVSHAQRFLPRNRNPGLMAMAEAKVAAALVVPMNVKTRAQVEAIVERDSGRKPKEKPKLMTPAELTAERWKVSRPKPLVIG